jgi:hypothetical protein
LIRQRLTGRAKVDRGPILGLSLVCIS